MIQSSGVFSLVAFLTASVPSTTAEFFAGRCPIECPDRVALGGFMVATRSGDFQLGLMLAALAVLVLPTAAEAYTPEGRQACTGDAFRLCIAEIPNVDRVRACLHRNKAQLSPGCRGFISPGAHRPAPGDR
jgi:hypothetical protein